jgi:hypothetical protein
VKSRISKDWIFVFFWDLCSFLGASDNVSQRRMNEKEKQV